MPNKPTPAKAIWPGHPDPAGDYLSGQNHYRFGEQPVPTAKRTGRQARAVADTTAGTGQGRGFVREVER